MTPNQYTPPECASLPANSDTTVVDVQKFEPRWAYWVQSVVNRDRCWYVLLMYQSLKACWSWKYPFILH